MNQFSIPLPHVEEIEVLLEELIDQEALDLVVFNDDVNTFEHVIQVLMKVCEHTHEQFVRPFWMKAFRLQFYKNKSSELPL